MSNFKVKNKKVLRKFYENYLTQVTIIKSGWKDMYLIIYEFADIECVRIDLFNEQQLLNKFNELTINELKLLS